MIWNQLHPWNTIRDDQWTHHEQDEVVLGVMRFALVVKVDGFLPEGLVEPCSCFRDGRLSVRGSAGPGPWGDWGFNRDRAIDTGDSEVKSTRKGHKDGFLIRGDAIVLTGCRPPS